MKELANKLKNNFNLDISNISPLRDNYIITTTQGKMLLKKQVISPERVLFIHNAKQHLIKNNFPYLDNFILSVSNEPFIILNNNLYTLTKIIDGQQVNFDNTADVIRATQLLTSFHISSCNFFQSPEQFSKNELGRLPIIYQKRLDEIKRAKKLASLGKTKFDYLLLDYIDYFYAMGRDVLDKLTCSCYMDLVYATQKEGSFCHHEFTHNNIVNQNGTYFLINFEYCCYELKIYDLCNLIKRKLRKCNWDIAEAKKIMDCYREKISLSQNELYIMKLMLMFPQKFWRVINTYYNSKKNLSDAIYLSKLNSVIEEIRPIEVFLSKYDTL